MLDLPVLFGQPVLQAGDLGRAQRDGQFGHRRREPLDQRLPSREPAAAPRGDPLDRHRLVDLFLDLPQQHGILRQLGLAMPGLQRAQPAIDHRLLLARQVQVAIDLPAGQEGQFFIAEADRGTGGQRGQQAHAKKHAYPSLQACRQAVDGDRRTVWPQPDGWRDPATGCLPLQAGACAPRDNLARLVPRTHIAHKR